MVILWGRQIVSYYRSINHLPSSQNRYTSLPAIRQVYRIPCPYPLLTRLLGEHPSRDQSETSGRLPKSVASKLNSDMRFGAKPIDCAKDY